MTKIILYSIVSSFSVWLIRTEIKTSIEAIFKTILVIFQTLEYALSDLKQRTHMDEPFNAPLSRTLVNLTWYGILLSCMILAIVANYSILKSRLEAFMPFQLTDEEQLLGLSGMIAVLITFGEIVMSWLLLEGWSNPRFVRFDVDPNKGQRPDSFIRVMSILPWVVFFFTLGIDIAVNYHGNFVQTGSALSSTIMALLTTVLSFVFSLVSFFCVIPFFVSVIILLRHAFSFTIECLALISFLIHGLLNKLMILLLSIIDILAKIGATIAKPFQRFRNPLSGRLPVPAKMAIILALIGLVSFAWSSQLRISKTCFVVLLDLTGSFHYANETYEHIDHIINTLLPGEEIYVLSIRETSFQDKNILFSGHIPLPKYTNEIYSKEYRARVDSLRAMLSHNWKETVKTLRTDAKRTDITGSIAYAALIFANSKSKQKYLVVFSDLEDNVAENCDVKLNNVRILCLYVEHSDFSQYQEKEKRWKEYFKRAGIEEDNIVIRIPAQSSIVEIR